MGIIQTNAIRSWLALCPPCEILLLGDDEGTSDIAKELGLRHFPDIDRNEFGTPLISSLFQTAEDAARHELLCQINADIMLTDDFLPAIDRIRSLRSKFLIAGRRWDLDIEKPWDFEDPNWQAKLRRHSVEHGTLHPPFGLDYFVFPKGLWGELPPFAIGRQVLDNWLIYAARSRRVPVIDASAAITAIHQNHDYSYHPEGERGIKVGLEARRNRELAGSSEHLFDLWDATHLLDDSGLKRALTWTHLRKRLYRMPFMRSALEALRSISGGRRE